MHQQADLILLQSGKHHHDAETPIPCVDTLVVWVDCVLQLQTSLMAARHRLEQLHQASQQQEQQAAEVGQQLAALRSERSAVAAEAHSAQQELNRVLRELDQCQKVSWAQLAVCCADWLAHAQPAL